MVETITDIDAPVAVAKPAVTEAVSAQERKVKSMRELLDTWTADVSSKGVFGVLVKGISWGKEDPGCDVFILASPDSEGRYVMASQAGWFSSSLRDAGISLMETVRRQVASGDQSPAVVRKDSGGAGIDTANRPEPSLSIPRLTTRAKQLTLTNEEHARMIAEAIERSLREAQEALQERTSEDNATTSFTEGVMSFWKTHTG